MRELDKQLIVELDLLIDMGKKGLASFRAGEYTGYRKDETLTQQWLTMSQSFLFNRLGAISEYYRSFSSKVGDVTTKTGYLSMSPGHVQNLIGILLAAKSDIERGVLLKIEQLIRAEAFADVHEQAEYLLKNGYKDAAAVLFGAVLESALRKLCEKQGFTLAPNEAMDSMNGKLATAENPLYNKYVQKQITAWADIRNNAAHGHFDKYSKKDVEDMGKWISNFLQEHNP